MSNDRLHVVLRLREMREKEQLVARAAAYRAAAVAQARLGLASAALAENVPTAGQRLDAAALLGVRLQGLALEDEVGHAEQAALTADRAAERAEQARVRAAVARRSVERLQARRQQQAAEEEKLVNARREDELGLQAWRRAR